MELSEKKLREYVRRLQQARLRLLCNHGFYGLLIMHMTFHLDESLDTAATDGDKILFGPQFLDEISDSELDFILMHEVMHAAMQHISRRGDRDPFAYNVACDIVVNSTIMHDAGDDEKSIALKKYGVSMHTAPNGKEGYEYTSEEVYEMFRKRAGRGGRGVRGIEIPVSGNGNTGGGDTWDDHSRWDNRNGDNAEMLSEVWTRRVLEAAQAMAVRESSVGRGLIPGFARRILEELKHPQIDWRTVLNEFVQQEVNDYSFSPPDRRFGDSPFFLPDYNEMADIARDILFMIDTSGSMSDAEITAAFSEVKGALEQFGGALKGWLGFFDSKIVPPQPFESDDELKIIHPYGGGGTDFDVVFHYVRNKMTDPRPACIIILTDGYAPFPDEKAADEIPVLWLIDNREITPPWGKVARIEMNG